MTNSNSKVWVNSKITHPLKPSSKHHNIDTLNLLLTLLIENCKLIIIKSGDVVNEDIKYFKKAINTKEIPIYRKGRFGVDKIEYRQYSFYFIEFLMLEFDLTLNQAIVLSKCIGSINVKSENCRYSKSIDGSFLLLDLTLLNLYFEQDKYIDTEGKNHIGYKFKNDTGLDFSLFNYLMDLNDVIHISNLNHYLKINMFDFIKMTLTTQFQLLKSLVLVKNYTLYFNLNTIQEIGNCGRRYNILNHIPR